MPGNEMIHIQEGYLRLHFHIFQTTTCYLHIKALIPDKGVWSEAGNPPRAFSGWPSHFNPNASQIALIFCQSRPVNQNLCREWTPVFGWNIPLIKRRVLVTQGQNQAPEPALLLLPEQNDRAVEWNVNMPQRRAHNFVVHPVGITNLDPLWCLFLLPWHCCMWQKVCGSVRKLY